MNRIIRNYNKEVASGSLQQLLIIHGYHVHAASGSGSVIKDTLRAYLESHGVEYEKGEARDNHNLGETLNPWQ